MTAPQTTTGAPAGFREVRAEEPTGVRLDKEALAQGVVVQFKGTRRFVRSSDNGTTTVHIFLARGGKGARFSTFGTAQLDSKLRSVKKDSVIWLRYQEKKVIDGQETHDWGVSDAGNRLDDAKVAELSKNSEREHMALDAAIRRAEMDNTNRRQGGAAPAPQFERELTDADHDEIPF